MHIYINTYIQQHQCYIVSVKNFDRYTNVLKCEDFISPRFRLVPKSLILFRYTYMYICIFLYIYNTYDVVASSAILARNSYHCIDLHHIFPFIFPSYFFCLKLLYIYIFLNAAAVTVLNESFCSIQVQICPRHHGALGKGG